MTGFNLKDGKKEKTWKKITRSKNTVAVFLLGSILEQEESGNDIDILVVNKRYPFSNKANKDCLGFEHIRHSESWDIYHTDEKHFPLAKEILDIDEKNVLYTVKDLVYNPNLPSELISIAHQLSEDEAQKLMNEGKDIDRDGWGKQRHNKILVI